MKILPKNREKMQKGEKKMKRNMKEEGKKRKKLA
jgi:hypothetical protein